MVVFEVGGVFEELDYVAVADFFEEFLVLGRNVVDYVEFGENYVDYFLRIAVFYV